LGEKPKKIKGTKKKKWFTVRFRNPFEKKKAQAQKPIQTGSNRLKKKKKKKRNKSEILVGAG